MIVRIARSTKQPVLYSLYLSKFSQHTLEMLKGYKPFASYNRATQEYEVTPDVYRSLTEVTERTIDERKPMPKFSRDSKEMYGYQQDAVAFAKKSDNVFVNFPQGMGKSYTTMKIIAARGFSRTLVVCGQGNLQEEWIKDATKHGLREALSINIVGGDTGAGNKKKVEWLALAADGTDLINIEALRNEAIVQQLNARHYDCIVVDEVQSAKGWKAGQTEGLHELVRYEGQVRIALSGTPVLNNPLEFFSMLKYFGLLRDTARTTFEKYYGEFGFDFWGHYVCKGYKNFADLKDLISPIICYASKDELHLPTKTRKLVNLTPDDSERFAYLRQAYKMSTARLKKAGFKSKPEVRAEMVYLSSITQSKIEFVKDHAKQAKVLVFSNYTKVLEKYQAALASNGVKVLYYHGDLSMKERLKVLDQWHTGEYDALLLSESTARYGLNLVEATETIFIEPPTSLAVLEQTEDRAHRIGQNSPVTSYLLSATEIDKDGLDNIQEKQEALDKLTDLLKAEMFA